MDIKEQFNLIAEEYDKNRRRFIPCFDDFYVGTTDFIAANITEPKRILDLGAGTGLLSYFWYEHFPEAEYLLVDIADDMLGVARKRFAGIENVKYQTLDYSQGLPDSEFDLIMSALSIHHLDNDEKPSLFSQIYNKLPDGGAFINYDQFCADQNEINEWFDTFWESRLVKSGLSDNDISLWHDRRKLDKECSVEKECEMISKCGFKNVKCVYSCQKFSVIIAIK